jgi:hypothetical protein
MTEYEIIMACSMRRRKCLLGKPEGKGPVGRSRHKLGIILKWILKIGWAGPGMVNSDSGEGGVAVFVPTVLGFGFAQNVGNLLSF